MPNLHRRFSRAPAAPRGPVGAHSAGLEREGKCPFHGLQLLCPSQVEGSAPNPLMGGGGLRPAFLASFWPESESSPRGDQRAGHRGPRRPNTVKVTRSCTCPTGAGVQGHLAPGDRGASGPALGKGRGLRGGVGSRGRGRRWGRAGTPGPGGGRRGSPVPWLC